MLFVRSVLTVLAVVAVLSAAGASARVQNGGTQPTTHAAQVRRGGGPARPARGRAVASAPTAALGRLQGPSTPPVASPSAPPSRRTGNPRLADGQPLAPGSFEFGTDARRQGHGHDHSAERSQCPVELSFLWATETHNSIYATPALFPLYHNGLKQAVLASYAQDVELVEHDGHKPVGWPVTFAGALFHASPLLYDLDADGQNDVVLCALDGRVIFVHLDEDAQYVGEYTLEVPRLWVRRDWFEGLGDGGADAYVELSAFESFGAGAAAGEGEFQWVATTHSRGETDGGAEVGAPAPGAQPTPFDTPRTPRTKSATVSDGFGPVPSKSHVVKQQPQPQPAKRQPAAAAKRQATPPASPVRRPAASAQGGTTGNRARDRSGGGAAAGGAAAGAGAAASSAKQSGGKRGPSAMASGATARGGGSHGGGSRRKLMQLGVDYDAAWDIEADAAALFGVDSDAAGDVPDIATTLDGAMVAVDVHLQSTPHIIDIDGDGVDELLITASYYYDAEVYPTTVTTPAGEVTPSKYVACGVLCYDLEAQDWRWQVHLDLSTGEGSLAALAVASPTAADLDGDGVKEIVVPTMLGFVHVLSADGKPRAGFPAQVGAVEGAVVAENVAGDADLELIVADSAGGVVVFSASGTVVWEKRVSGACVSGSVVGDIDSDGRLDVAVVTLDGAVWALRGSTGEPLMGFPVRLADKVLAPVTLLRLTTSTVGGKRASGHKPTTAAAAAGGGGRAPAAAAAAAATAAAADPDIEAPATHVGLDPVHLVVPCFDGHLYVINGESGCTNLVDVGEHVYAAVLADDLSEDGRLELLVSTMNGNFLAFATDTPYHPLNSLPAQSDAGAGTAFRDGYHGVHFLEGSHKFRDVVGDSVELRFAIVDNRPVPAAKRSYDVRIAAGRIDLFRGDYTEPGQYAATVTFPTPQRASVQITMYNEHGQRYTDVTSLGFNTQFYTVLKWMLLLPFAAATALLLTLHGTSTPLPTFA